MGKSLNQLVRDYLEQLAGSACRNQQWTQFEARCLQSSAKLDGWQFNRDEANER
ncbi:MerR family transcriptional regulator [Candidatus Regiella endosymbiont of Tuberolachnus salignus]|uniref:MerR family transcriptional regulator n=1 Tax=Candidatus Regiella endosymbiont of Tuberolachnus salignus TaxID=3077956 RepID=UPI0030CBB154